MPSVKFFLLVALLFLAMARLATADRLSDFVNEYLKKNKIPGCAVMVRHDGKLVLCQGYGVANLEHGVRVTPQTVFQSGSIGKQFTAMAVMMLIEEKKTRARRSDLEIHRRTGKLVCHSRPAFAYAHLRARRLS